MSSTNPDHAKHFFYPETNGAAASSFSRLGTAAICDLGVREQTEAAHSEELNVTFESSPPPFILRAHHIRNLSSLFTFHTPYSPQENAALLVEGLSPDLKHLGSTNDPFSALDLDRYFSDGDYKNTYKASYANDVIGNTTAQADEFRESYVRWMHEFLNLDPHSLILLTSHEKDGICRSCIHGEHCSTDQYNGDQIFIKIYTEIVRHFTPLDCQLVPVISTTTGDALTEAGTLRRVMCYFGLGEKMSVDGTYNQILLRYKEGGELFDEQKPPLNLVNNVRHYGYKIGIDIQ